MQGDKAIIRCQEALESFCYRSARLLPEHYPASLAVGEEVMLLFLEHKLEYNNFQVRAGSLVAKISRTDGSEHKRRRL